MKLKAATSALIGAKVRLDYPVRWQGALPEYRDQLRAEAEKREAYFGQAGTITSYVPGRESGKEYDLLLAETGQVIEAHPGYFTVEELAPSYDKQIVDLLVEIRDLMRVQL